MFVELHIIQSFPPSNLNRDDLGQPKDADFGGYRRARISSQCLKRAIRFAGRNEDTGVPSIFERYTGVSNGMRTKRLKQQLETHLKALGCNETESDTVARVFAEAYAGKMDERRKDETAVLLYFTDSEVAWIADELRRKWDDVTAYVATRATREQQTKEAKTQGKKDPLEDTISKLLKETAQRTSAPDIALFGRMLADKPETNVDAACQVAHAISTHDIGGHTPIDYYTAVDDLKPQEESGAGFLDVAYFNSACFYRYARLDYKQLKVNLGTSDLQGNDLADLPLRTVEAFLRASEAAIPSGKKNAFAPECRPSFMMAVVRSSDSQGWSLVNAFRDPVRVLGKDGDDLAVASVRRLQDRFRHLKSFYGDDSIKAMAVALPDGTVSPDDLDDSLRPYLKPTMDDWVRTIRDALQAGG